MRFSLIKKFFVLAFVSLLLIFGVTASAQESINIWWPTNNSVIQGVQPLKALVPNQQIEQYNMWWQVDNGQLNFMSNSYQDHPHKETSIDFTSWGWKGTGPYEITLVARNLSNSEIARRTIQIYTGQPVVVAPTQTPTPTVSPTPTRAPTPTPTTPLPTPTQTVTLSTFYVDPYSNAKQQADQWRSSRPQDALQMDKIASQPQAQWFGNWNSNISSDVNALITAGANKNTIPVMVLYNIPQRDCGGFSQGGINSPSGYRSWIDLVANAIGGRKALVVLEPDALSLTNCLSQADRQTRYDLISYAVSALKNKGASVYVDAGHPNWIDSSEMAQRLQKSGINNASGFALNVSNFMTTQNNISYGSSISQKIGGKHFIIDTGRNGQGPTGDFQWCNPSGRALGAKPSISTGNEIVDAFLWIKKPGESDGNCNGGPSAGSWWAEYALGLAQRTIY